MLGGGGYCNDCVPAACMVGLGGHSMAGTVLYCRSTVTGCSGCQGSRDVFPALDGGAGVGHEGIFSLVAGAHASRCVY